MGGLGYLVVRRSVAQSRNTRYFGHLPQFQFYMQPPETRNFVLDRLLSENGACQTWVAKPVNSDHLVLVKVVQSGQEPEVETGRKILTESFRLQAVIRSPWVVRAHRQVSEDNRTLIEYPYLDPAIWRELTVEALISHLDVVLPSIAMTVDYLHLLGLVHGDLKISNFMIDTGAPPRVRLVDLDFLCAANSTPNARIFGTPDHIAPELLANDRIVAQSDNYSLGVELRLLLERRSDIGGEVGGCAQPVVEKLQQLIVLLTTEDVLQRPRSLLQVLTEVGLLAPEGRAWREKELLRQILRARFAQLSATERAKAHWLSAFLRHRCQILGLSDELLAAFATCFESCRRRAWRAFSILLGRSPVELHGDYFHLRIDDDTLLETYNLLLAGDLRATGGITSDATSFPAVFERAKGLDKVEQRELAFLLYRRAHQCLAHGDSTIRAHEAAILERLASLAEQTGRLAPARTFYTALSAVEGLSDNERIRADTQHAYLANSMGKFDEAVAIMEAALPIAERANDQRIQLGFQRLRGWLMMSKRDYAQANSLLAESLRQAQEAGLTGAAISTRYAQGVVLWNQGHFQAAREEMRQALALADAGEYVVEITPVLCGLALLCFEMAEYGSAIKFGKQAVGFLTDQKRPSSLATVCQYLMISHVRLADQPKAEHWRHRFLEVALATGDIHQLVACHQTTAFAKLAFGDLRGAKEELSRALEARSPQMPPVKLLGKMHQLLVEIAVEEGRQDQAERHAEAAEAIFERGKDEASIHEVCLLRLLGRHYTGDRSEVSAIAEEVRHLVGLRSHYMSVLGYYHLQLLAADGRPPVEPPVILREERAEIDKVPLFAASRVLLDPKRRDRDGLITTAALKEALRILLAARHRSLAMLTEIRLGELYRTQQRPRHAQKFLEQALRQADSSNNRTMVVHIRGRLASVASTGDTNERLIASFRAMSDILRGIGNYRDSLAALIQFAIDQSGAERGVLLLRSGTADRLYVAASLDCDDQSLTDILDFSHSVPNSVIREAKPLVVENAVEDRRTSHYQSILMHNILSVLAVPLVYDDEPLGVLYLDHHAIPTLFEKQDITYIETIANIIAVTLATASNFRTLRYANIELRENLSQLGHTGEFKTRNPAMLRLLGDLEGIAKTSAPVLILGETGTGKEIICNTIHQLSLRAFGNLVKLNCAALPRDNVESELFGVEDNAYTGVKGRDGKLAAADGGTMYFDEIGDLALEVQAKLLRVIEYQCFERLGGTRSLNCDVRFVYATNRDLEAMIEDEKFREDLYHRINTIVIEIPPLRDRPDDIPLLVDFFVGLYAKGKVTPIIAPEVYDAFLAYRWPGNVRELKNLIERFCILYPGQRVTKSHLPSGVHQARVATSGTRKAIASAEATRMKECLIRAGGNVSEAARYLKMPLTTFRRKMKRYHLRSSA